MLSKFIPRKEQTENSDLGFGRIVSESSTDRLINKDGSFNVHRKGLRFFGSLHIYHTLLTMSWTRFLILASLGYFTLNLFFALLYTLLGSNSLFGPPDDINMNPFIRAFFFSVQTSTTIGYGHILPHGFMTNVLVTLESFIGLMGFAILTGMLFARFSRPVAKIIYSKNAIIAPYHDNTAFEFRIVNSKSNQLYNVQAQVTFSMMQTINQKTSRRYFPLHLERNNVPFFPLSWTIVHPIDDKSPLYNVTHEQMIKDNAEFLVLVSGTDDTFNQTVLSQTSYKADEVIYQAQFKDIYKHESHGKQISIDISKLSDIVKL